MAKKILAIFFVSILLCSYIIPTTSVFADVVIGDNDSYAVTELGVENGKKIATMEAILQLLESGVSEINFDDISDLDNYLDEFYDELTNVNYQDVSNAILVGAYNDVKELKQWIDDRGEYIATYYKDYLNSADQGLSDIFNNFQLKLPKSKLVGTSLRGVRGLSRFNGDSGPTPSPDTNYSQYLDIINGQGCDNYINYYTQIQYVNGITPNIWDRSISYFNNKVSNKYETSASLIWQKVYNTPTIYNLYIYSSNNQYSYSIIIPYTDLLTNFKNQYGYWNYVGNYTSVGTSPNEIYTYLGQDGNPNINVNHTFATLTELFEHLQSCIHNVNIYVDDIPWSIVGVSQGPTLDIDGIIKIYGNDNPIQYEFPQGTQIDYNALYTTIYNAIRDNLPLDMQTINNNQVYYDSHDTVYSPTIYNYYGKDGDDENDWIDSILDYATIPDFNAVLGTVAVLDAPFVNGITIVNAGVTDVIPSDILVILGGFFVLVLFVCIINRMSE